MPDLLGCHGVGGELKFLASILRELLGWGFAFGRWRDHPAVVVSVWLADPARDLLCVWVRGRGLRRFLLLGVL